MQDGISRRGFMHTAGGMAAALAGAGAVAGTALATTPRASGDSAEQLAELAAKEAIRDQLHNYQRSMDRCDAELGYGCFWDDATITVGDYFDHVSPRDFVDSCVTGHKTIFATSHQINNVLVEVHGDKAGSESYALPYMLFKQEDGSFTMSLAAMRYLDKWEKRDGEWRIVERLVTNDGGCMVPNVQQVDKYESSQDTSDASYEFLAYGL